MTLKIAAWNIEGRLNGYAENGRGSADHILREIKMLDADIIVLPEFYARSLKSGVRQQLQEMGYLIIETPYDDFDRREGKWGYASIAVLSRLPLEEATVIRPGNIRNLIACCVRDPQSSRQLRIIATHLDDRSEVLRMKQASELVPLLNADDTPVIMLGDFNAMWRHGRGRLIASRPARVVARIASRLGVGDVAVRATDMATGTVLETITEQTKLRDVDTRRESTATPKQRDALFLPSLPMIQIDHMLVSSGVDVHDFKVHKDGGSDHRAISALIEW